jgi:SAM-dependent methyltransferase
VDDHVVTYTLREMDRFDRLREHIDVAKGRGLEIGPLASPIVQRSSGDVYYVDHLSTDDLITKYTNDPDVDERKIVSTDFVWGANTLAEAVGASAPFDYVVASHVLEHVPDLVGWLDEVAAVLRPGGRLSLALPDRRYTFDVRRRNSDISEVVEAYLLNLRRPAVRAIFDHFYRYVAVDPGAIWGGRPGHNDPPEDVETALAFATKAATTDAYLDTHCWVFSDATFVALIATLMQMDLVTMPFVAFRTTQPGEFEFFVTFEKPPDGLSPEELRALCLDSVPTLPGATTRSAPRSTAATSSSVSSYVLSDREVAVIDMKRKAMASIRGGAARLKRRR